MRIRFSKAQQSTQLFELCAIQVADGFSRSYELFRALTSVPALCASRAAVIIVVSIKTRKLRVM